MVSCSRTICWKDYFSSLSYLGTFVENQINMYGFIPGIYSLFHWFTCHSFTAIECYLDYCNFIINLEIRECKSSKLVAFQNYFGSFGPLCFSTNFRIGLSIYAKHFIHFDWGCVEFRNQFGPVFILTIQPSHPRTRHISTFF